MKICVLSLCCFSLSYITVQTQSLRTKITLNHVSDSDQATSKKPTAAGNNFKARICFQFLETGITPTRVRKISTSLKCVIFTRMQKLYSSDPVIVMCCQFINLNDQETSPNMYKQSSSRDYITAVSSNMTKLYLQAEHKSTRNFSQTFTKPYLFTEVCLSTTNQMVKEIIQILFTIRCKGV